MARAYKALPPASELWELFEYNPLTGDLFRRKTTSNAKGAKAGDKAGTPQSRGYIHTHVKNTAYLNHRLIWRWVTGKDPQELEVDHKNRKRNQNGWHNLRLATQPQNARNSKVRSHNRSGVKGAKLTDAGTYQARITFNGVRHYLGTFTTAEEARAAYEKASLELHGEFSGVR
jgi:hypothetical protein